MTNPNDPGMHETGKNALFLMDCRVKPGNDDNNNGPAG
ncbi:MAG: hypothetical protein V7634_3164 [Bradyrhizobium sp.]|jgi:hypothetical protein